MVARADLELRAAAVLELRRREAVTPLAYRTLWHQDAPRTSQREAIRLDYSRDAQGNLPLLTLLLGGNRTGKSEAMAMWAVAQAAGIDHVVDDGGRRVEWVRKWCARNGLDEGQFPKGRGTVWVASPAFGIAREQIRPKIKDLVPKNSRFVAWDQISEAEVHLLGGGVIRSKAYKQFDQDRQTWEGAAVRAIAYDEQPNSYANVQAGFSRLIDYKGRSMMALTPLRGKADWLYRDVVRVAPEWLRVAYLHGADNPHVDPLTRSRIMGTFAAWQRKARDFGLFVSPEGTIYPFDRGVHCYEQITWRDDEGREHISRLPPAHWIRYQGIDWGTRHPHVLWAAEDPRNGDLYVYRELAPRRTMTEPGLPAEALCRMILDAERGQPEAGFTPCLRVGDSADPDAIAEANGLGLNVAPANKGKIDGQNATMKGIELVEALLRTQDPATGETVRPRLYVSTACPVLCEELEELRWGPEVPGQEPAPDPECPDHGADALRYLVRYRMECQF